MRLTAPWVVGFVDREGSFKISIRYSKHLERHQIFPEFSVSQKKRYQGLLYDLKVFFRCGNVRHHYNYGGMYRSNKKYMVYTVVGLKLLLEVIIPFFEQYPLKTIKRQREFERFRTILFMVQRGEHLTKEGMKQIMRIRYQLPFFDDE